MRLKGLPSVERPIRGAAGWAVSLKKQDELVQRIKVVIGALRATSDRNKRSTLLDELLVLTRLLSDLVQKEKGRWQEFAGPSRGFASSAGQTGQ